LVASLLLAVAASAASQRAGQAQTVRGAVTARSEEVTRPLEKGGDFFVGDLIATGRRGLAVLSYADGTRFMLGQESEMRIAEYREPAEGTGKLTAEIAKGTFRFVSGVIAKTHPEAMQVQVSRLATIGIRGTDVGGEVEGGRATIVLLDTGSAITVSNPFGAAEIDQPGWGTEIPDERSPPSPPRRMHLRSVESLVRNLGRMQRVPRFR